MPEIVTAGVDGALVDDDDPVALAGTIAGLLADDALYARTAGRAADVVSHYSWDRAANDALTAIGRSLRSG